MYYIELDIEREHQLCIDLPFELGNDINRFNEKQPYSLFLKNVRWKRWKFTQSILGVSIVSRDGE